MGGSRDTELNELIVSPTGLCSWPPSVVMTVTPVAKRPKADRKKRESKSGGVAVIRVGSPTAIREPDAGATTAYLSRLEERRAVKQCCVSIRLWGSSLP